MKSTFIFALLALGTLICATKAAPSSSEMQQDDGDMKKLLELIDRAARSQQGDDETDTEAQSFFRKLFGTVRKGASWYKKHKKTIHAVGKGVHSLMKGGDENGDENGRDSILELMDRAARLQEEDDDGDDMKVKAQFFGFLKRLWNKHKHTIHKVAKHLMNGGENNGENGDENSGGENMKELAELLDRVAKLQDEDDNGDRHRRQRRQIHAK